jgi:hypothetical protein
MVSLGPPDGGNGFAQPKKLTNMGKVKKSKNKIVFKFFNNYIK